MDKCTTEQFWVVVAMNGVNAFVIANLENISSLELSTNAIVAVLWALASVSFLYVLSRHFMYYKLKTAQADLFTKADDLKEFFETRTKKGKPKYSFLFKKSRLSALFSLTGTGIYTAWIVIGTVAATISL